MFANSRSPRAPTGDAVTLCAGRRPESAQPKTFFRKSRRRPKAERWARGGAQRRQDEAADNEHADGGHRRLACSAARSPTGLQRAPCALSLLPSVRRRCAGASDRTTSRCARLLPPPRLTDAPPWRLASRGSRICSARTVIADCSRGMRRGPGSGRSASCVPRMPLVRARHRGP